MGAQELRKVGDDVVIVFDGAGSTAAAEIAQPGHHFHTLFTDVLPAVRGVCRFCAKRYGVLDAVQAADLPLLDDDRGDARRCPALTPARPSLVQANVLASLIADWPALRACC